MKIKTALVVVVVGYYQTHGLGGLSMLPPPDWLRGHLEHELGVTLPLDGEHALAAVVNCFISGGISQERTLTRCDLKNCHFNCLAAKNADLETVLFSADPNR